MLLLYPANTFSHEAAADFLGDRMPLSERMRESEIALALDPMNPYTRDAYMRELAARRPGRGRAQADGAVGLQLAGAADASLYVGSADRMAVAR